MPKNYKYSRSSEWWTALQQKMELNRQVVSQSINSTSLPMNFYCAFDVVCKSENNYLKLQLVQLLEYKLCLLVSWVLSKLECTSAVMIT